ncbi:ABC transporter ATP-binding protein [Rubellimicrobium sp. CFH 75288]|uniref:ABC transporter ATP-binding protein n=1 Tax=Rubellimicrobium sp. CFH 75288 TaxID=2697034 RepID=UPI001412CF8B|nr:ABC transporter ATP-binding protein [Rubellimicrobium sp. CFH 75288]NAZ37868.1 ATP-binding cassette domain-containing protein [Rubellimicrobium sp. CFH 75288]
MVDIVLEGVTKRFGAQVAVDHLDTRFASGEVTCLLGPSGCGKTTLMRMIAGLETPSEGRILIGGRDVAGLPPRARDVGMVFQYPVMYPTLSVAENIEEPLRHDRRLSADERARRVDEMLDVLDMRALRDALIDELNTGLRQKVAVGRAVARHAEVVLFDEPTTNIEVDSKLQLIRAIKSVTSRLRQTIVYVTHDQTEAMTLADSIALMEAGRIVQQDAPRALYAAPRTRFAGWFLGNPGMNYLPVACRDGRVEADILSAPIPLPAGVQAGALTLGVRPEWITVGAGRAEGVVTDRVIGIGGRRLLTVRHGGETLRIKCAAAEAPPPGAPVRFSVPPDRVVLFDPEGRALEHGAPS